MLKAHEVAGLAATVFQIREALASFEFIERRLDRLLKKNVEWFSVELSLARGAAHPRFTIKPTERLSDLLAAAATPECDELRRCLLASHDEAVAKSPTNGKEEPAHA